MNTAQFQVLLAARALPDFTVSELVRASGANANTVKSIFKRHAEMFEPTGAERRAHGARKPGRVFRVRVDARRRLDAIARHDLEQAGGLQVDPDLAREEIADDYGRWQVRRALQEARKAEGRSRWQWVAEATHWMDHERERLARWSVAAPTPPDVAAQMDRLSDQLAASLVGADRLRDAPALRTLSGAIEWAARGFEAWVSAEAKAEAFAPLILEPGRPLGPQLRAAVAAAPVGGVASERLIVAFLGALHRTRRRSFRDCVETLIAIDDDHFAEALREELGRGDPDEDQELFAAVNAVLAAFPLCPRLLDERQKPKLALWASRFCVSSLMRPEFTPRVLRLMKAAPQRNLEQVRGLLEPAMNRFRDLERHGDARVERTKRADPGYGRDARLADRLRAAPPISQAYELEAA